MYSSRNAYQLIVASRCRPNSLRSESMGRCPILKSGSFLHRTGIEVTWNIFIFHLLHLREHLLLIILLLRTGLPFYSFFLVFPVFLFFFPLFTFLHTVFSFFFFSFSSFSLPSSLFAYSSKSPFCLVIIFLFP